MREINTIDPGRYEEGSRPGLVRQIGMIGAQELFDKLKAHLESVDLIPDEYFLSGSHYWNGNNPELPQYSQAVCHTNWGGSEGIYIDIDLQYLDDKHELKSFHLATGKTLGSSGDDFLRMSRIAAECSMMLNGWGVIVKVNEQEQGKAIEPNPTSDKAVDMLEALVNSNILSDREAVAKVGYGLDRLVHDKSWTVRKACAAQGAGQSILVNDPEPAVRETLAEHGYCLDILMNDKSPFVRAEVAKQGYGLDQLARDNNEIVRAAVVDQARPQDLIILVNDESPYIRSQVASQGFGLDKLIKDPKKEVRFVSENYLLDNNLTLSEWKDKHPDRCVLTKNKKKSLDNLIADANQKKEKQTRDDIKEKLTDDRDLI